MVGIPTNAHTPRFGERLKTRDHIVHIVHKSPRLVMATWPHGHGQRAIDPCGHCPHCPPLKYYIVRFCKVVGCGPRGILLSAKGPRVGPSAEGHGSGGATNKIFNSPHCPHDPQIFKFIFYVYWTHTHGDCQQSLAIWGFQSLDKQCPAVLARRVNV